ncbi:MAG: DUF3387 domain-containing protein [Thermogutta sp.]|nr:DUF3387 domain-containing protein [Thermogutta sp.]
MRPFASSDAAAGGTAQVSFIGFTGTPIELADADARAVFGDYISIHEIQRTAEDGATVPIYYKSRLAKLALDEAERPKIDPQFEEAAEEKLACYDALETNDSTVKVLGDEPLRGIARELVVTGRNPVTVDCTLRESGRGQLRVRVERILRSTKTQQSAEIRGFWCWR